MISDLQLPGMSGIDLAKRLQKGPHAQPVIIVTAYGTPQVLSEMRRVGVTDCFPKPFPLEMLRRSVHRALEQTNGRRRKVANGGEV